MKEESLQYISNKRRDFKFKLKGQMIFLCAVTIIASLILNGVTRKTGIISGSAFIVCLLAYIGVNSLHRKMIIAKRKAIIETNFPIKDDILTGVQQELILLDIDYFLNGSRQKNDPYSVFTDSAALKSRIEEGEALINTEMEGLNGIYSVESIKRLGR
ncbi:MULTISPECIES: hypothetical protein [unclassified Paenibacillus]|uniref:hypothetical protein n=1 Tax=unclassified Paenibacillus TaxID=185978 RepID=UPI002405F381|nr:MULTISPECIES: hypothetical protein [unclassified Paenibacillus]MDF9840468.1 hypothetical protein [Paenibacillus sp. PastF-2]MDF9847050.1 hypothetical protein [Paenibacillus sp. PastM-2]MDF9853622.1 hypothetical protein [Paenibacillus sp. PastF-1]MDH6478892.1 hypothetical protein [Paenibacillus sp. PastH-2]MDH6506624.1 hypothetical protein [Paenibacillus sp. PastM-3]